MLFAIKNMKASRVNLLMNDFAAGLPSPLAFIGLGDAIARRLGLEPWSARTLPILHRVDVSQGRTKPEMIYADGAFSPVETMEDLCGTVETSLLLDLPGFESAAKLQAILPDFRLAGGVFQHHDFKVDAVPADGDAFHSLRRGYAMIRPDQTERRLTSTGENESLSAIAATLFPTDRPEGFGWIVPSAVGYRLLEDLEKVPKRSGTRDRDVPHVFAEPVLGIAELVSVRSKRLTVLGAEAFSDLFWSWDARGDFVLGHSAYAPITKRC